MLAPSICPSVVASPSQTWRRKEGSRVELCVRVRVKNGGFGGTADGKVLWTRIHGMPRILFVFSTFFPSSCFCILFTLFFLTALRFPYFLLVFFFSLSYFRFCSIIVLLLINVELLHLLFCPFSFAHFPYATFFYLLALIFIIFVFYVFFVLQFSLCLIVSNFFFL